MNDEEKAKAYDEALKAAQCWLNSPQAIEDFGYTVEDAIQNIFPKLRESEDERIRKALIDGVRQIRCKNGITQEQMLTYLEKQKEQKVDIDKLRKDIYQSGYNDGYQHGKEDAQKEQEPPEDTDTLRAKLVNFLIRNHIREDEAKYLADRISDTYGAQRYLDGLWDAANAYEQQEQLEVDFDELINDFLLNNSEFLVERDSKVVVQKLARHFYELGLNARKED